jgi:hypothetical protein
MFAANAARWQVHGFAYNLGNFLRTQRCRAEPIKLVLVELLKVMKIGANAISRGRSVAFQMGGRHHRPNIPGDLAADRRTDAEAIAPQRETGKCCSV